MSNTDLHNQNNATWWPTVRHFIAGSASGVALVLVGHGFDTVKVRLQTEGTKGRFNGPIHCLMKTLQEEGIRGLYKGATPPMIATGFINSCLFGMMGMCKARKQADPSTPPTIGDVMFCGMTTGWAISFIVTPIEMIKARLQVQYAGGAAAQYKGPIDCARQVYRMNGIRGLYMGLTPTILHRGSNWAYFGAYEIVRRALTPPGQEGKMSPMASIVAGAAAGTAFWLSCYPIDVIKNRMQTAPIPSPTQPPKYRNLVHCAKTIYLQEGWRAFFKGFTPCIIRSLPANSAAFLTFEFVYHHVLPATIRI